MLRPTAPATAAMFAALTLLPGAARAAEAPAKPLELAEGDRVVMLGNTLIERDIAHNHLETLLTARFADRNVTFRNLGWSGDTVFGHARAGFGTVADGFKALAKQLEETKPTVLIVGYGLNESFDGPAALPAFSAGLERLLDLPAAKAVKADRVVLLSPTRMENLGKPRPDPAVRNKVIRQYADAVRDVAAKRGHRFVDLFEAVPETPAAADARSTDNGLHLTARGYREVAVRTAAAAFGVEADKARAAVDAGSGDYEELRRVIGEKNELFFHRWRPQNETYLFGFRKHEQGRNAAEIPQFDPFIAEKEKEIAKLRTPVARRYQLSPAGAGK